jgi:hypothetical protein
MKRGKYFILICSLLVLCSGSCYEANNPPLEASELNFLIVGGKEETTARFGADFSPVFQELKKDKIALDTFLLAIAEQPQNKKKIAQASSLQESKIETLISSCQSIKLIRRTQGKWTTTVPVIRDQQMLLIKENLTPLARSLTKKVKAEIREIKALYEKEKATSDPPWNDVAHLVIDKFLVDGTFHAAIEDLEHERVGQEFYTQDQKTLPAFFLEQGEHTANFGCNWYPFEHNGARREIYVLHGTLLDRIDIPLNRYRKDPDFSSGLFKISPSGEYSDLSQLEMEVFKDLGWIGEERLIIPVLYADSVKTFLPLIEKTGKEMAEIVFSDYSIFLDSFKASPYSQFLDRAGDYIQACYHILFSLIIDKLVEEEVIPPVPKPVSDSYGVYMTLGSVWD